MARDQLSGWAWPAGRLGLSGLLGRRAWAWAELHALRRPALWPTGPRPLHKQTRHDLQTL